MPGGPGGSSPPILCRRTDPGLPDLAAFAHALFSILTAQPSAAWGTLRDVPGPSLVRLEWGLWVSGVGGGGLLCGTLHPYSLPTVQGGVPARREGVFSSLSQYCPRLTLVPAVHCPLLCSPSQVQNVDPPDPGAAWGCRVGHSGLDKDQKQDPPTVTLSPSTEFQPRGADGMVREAKDTGLPRMC